MTTINHELYQALKEVGASEDTARRASHSVLGIEERDQLVTKDFMRAELADLKTALEARFAPLESDLRWTKWTSLSSPCGWSNEDPMTDDQVLVSEVLRAIQGDIASLRNEMRDDFHTLGQQVAGRTTTVAGLTTAVYAGHDRFTVLEQRIERIEKRLELTD